MSSCGGDEIKNNDAFIVEILKEIKEISNCVYGLRTDVALIKSRQTIVIEEVKGNKAEVDAYCCEDRKMHSWLRGAVFILIAVQAMILLGGESASRELIKGALQLF